MPNYVYSNLFVIGDKKELEKFKKFSKGNETLLDMNKFIPYPQKFIDIDIQNEKEIKMEKKVIEKIKNDKKLTKKEKEIANYLSLCELNDSYRKKRTDGYNSGGYEWCINNWGTKWNFCDVEFNKNKKWLKYVFTTAWSIPMPILYKMSEMFPKLTFEYSGNEESEEFEVEYKFKKGKIIDIKEKDWKDIQIEKINEGNLESFDSFGDGVCVELEKHTGHDIIYNSDKKEFNCKTCENKLILKY